MYIIFARNSDGLSSSIDPAITLNTTCPETTQTQLQALDLVDTLAYHSKQLLH